MSADLQSILSARLEAFRRNSDGSYQARCPVCASEGHDKQRDHLRVWPSGAFRCAKYAKDAPGEAPLDHNRLIRAFVYQNVDPATLALLETQIIDPEPKLVADKVYPEETLTQMVPDHRYWVGRGISEEVLRRFEGGLHPEGIPSKMSKRYLFPVRDYPSRRIVGWTGRLTESTNSFAPKWKHLVKSGRALYPLTVTADAIRTARKVVLVESPGDGLSLFQGGIPYVAILFGLNMNSRWLGWLASADLDQIVISTNNDAIGKPQSDCAGNKAAEKLRAKLVPFFGEERVKVRLPQSANDWNDVLRKGTGELALFREELEGTAKSGESTQSISTV
jgi:hypothetical protein